MRTVPEASSGTNIYSDVIARHMPPRTAARKLSATLTRSRPDTAVVPCCLDVLLLFGNHTASAWKWLFPVGLTTRYFVNLLRQSAPEARAQG